MTAVPSGRGGEASKGHDAMTEVPLQTVAIDHRTAASLLPQHHQGLHR